MLVGMCRVRMSGLVVALVPAYNEESYVASVLVRLMGQVDRVVVCDDGSITGWLVHDSYIGAFF